MSAHASGPETERDPGRDRRRDPLDRAFAERILRAATPLVRWFDAEVHGAEKIPAPSLIVTNHAFAQLDGLVLTWLIHRARGILVRGLVDRNLLASPLLGPLYARAGAVAGTREAGVALLQRGEVVGAAPGGVRESFKGPRERYSLLWESSGYMAVAIEAGVPIVPVMGIGIDEAYPSLMRERFLGRRIFGSERYDLPLVLGMGPLPWPVKWDFWVGEPYLPPATPELARDRDAVRALHDGFRTRSQAFLDELRRAPPRGGWRSRFTIARWI